VELPVPPQFRFEPDVSSADWFAKALKPWGKDRIRLRSFLPDTFEAYARFPNHLQHDMEGGIQDHRLEELVRVLKAFTRTSDRCWLAAWVGWGSWGPGSSAVLTAVHEPPRRKRSRRKRIYRWQLGGRMRDVQRAAAETQRKLNALPKLRTQAREYFLFTARVGDVSSFAISGFPQTPNIWWPDDRAWCVATEVDGYDSYVGGSNACIEAVLSSELLRAGPMAPDRPISQER
jgi:hypothetical protein